MERVILEIGSERFPKAVFAEARRALGIRQLVVYRWRQDQPVERLFAESANDDDNMNRVIGQYSQGLYGRDPIRHHIRPQPDRRLSIHHVEADSMDDATFRDRLYRPQQMASKTAIVVNRPDDALVISLMRGEEAGALSPDQWSFVEGCAAYLAAAVERHVDLVAATTRLDWRAALERLPVAPPLSRQEVLVCSYILDGYFNEAIALNMGLSVHSVITYRRRAFAKLGISTQSELFGLVIRSRVH